MKCICDQVMEAVEAYRKVLSEAEDRSVVISAIGFATNLANLLQSEGDSYSPLNGWDLVATKVKTVVWQGGWYPPLHGFGHHTYNWDCGAGFYNTEGCNGASEYAVNNMPPSVEMVYSDIGDEVITGRELSYCASNRNPCRAALEDQQGYGNGRCSWDPVVTLRAVREDFTQWAENAGEGDGRLNVDYWGTNTWQDGDISGHKWLVLNGAWSEDWGMVNGARRSLEEVIDDLLCQGPNPTEPPPPPTTQNPPGTPARIYSPLADMCLHVNSNSDHPEDYTNVDVAACDGSDKQLWCLSSSGEVIHKPSGKCLDADGNNDNEVELYTCSGAAWQKWDLRGKTLKNRGLGRCLDIKNCPSKFLSSK